MTAPRDAQHAQVMLAGVESTIRLLGTDRPDYTISGEQDPTREYLSPAQALACLALVRDYLGPDCDPKLYRDHEGPFWNISYEGGPEDWAYRSTSEVTWPAGVQVECIAASWCIALYPDPDAAPSKSDADLADDYERAVARGNEWGASRLAARMAKRLRER